MRRVGRGDTVTDDEAMDTALGLARAALGTTAPNPAVGCVIVRDGEVIGEGVTGRGGRPHAEELALSRAGSFARGATAYVTLEPCAARSHGGFSCSTLLARAGVARVVVACSDPHQMANGAGLKELRDAGVVVEEGLRREDAEALNAGFFKTLREGRPLVAIDADGSTYDADLSLDPDDDLDAALKALGAKGLTRVRAKPGGVLAAALRKAGLIDYDAAASER